jgi:pyruvate/2-oxoglutarate dehydrogenase complex dihydrolipoamide acyltransferase (E2) component
MPAVKEHPAYDTAPFSKLRQMQAEGMRLGGNKSTIHGLLEVDVTKVRRFIRDHKARTGETLSFTAFAITCLGKAVDMDRRVQAYRDWRNRLVIFDDVDVNTVFETEDDGEKVVVAYFVRAANRKSFRQIHDEIRAFQAADRIGARTKQMKLFYSLPGFVRRIFYWVVFHNPHLLKKSFCTVAMSAIGMFGTGGGWGIPVANHTLSVILGGIGEKPVLVDGRLENREYLCVTVSCDHVIVDGAQGTRFAQRFKELLESGYGLVD